MTGKSGTYRSECEPYPMLLKDLVLFLLPHRNQRLQVGVIRLCVLKVVQSLEQYLAYAAILDILKQCPDRLDKFLVDTASKSLARVVCQNSHKHNGIVLPGRSAQVVLAEKFANDTRAFGCGCRGRFRSIDNRGQEEDFIALYFQQAGF